MPKFVYRNYDLGKDPAEGVRTIIPFLRKKDVNKILDYHCGNGRNAIYLCQQGFQITAADYRPVIDSLEKLVMHKDFPIQVCILSENQISLPFPDLNFDATLVWRCLHRGTADQRKAEISELRRVIRETGYLIAAVSSDTDIGLDAQRRPQQEIEERTFRYTSKGIFNVRHYFTKEEIETGETFPGFAILSIKEITEKTGHKERGYMRHYWYVLAQKISQNLKINE